MDGHPGDEMKHVKVSAAWLETNCILLATLRDWVPEWLWTYFLYPTGIYEIWPFGWVFYRQVAKKGTR